MNAKFGELDCLFFKAYGRKKDEFNQVKYIQTVQSKFQCATNHTSVCDSMTWYQKYLTKQWPEVQTSKRGAKSTSTKSRFDEIEEICEKMKVRRQSLLDAWKPIK